MAEPSDNARDSSAPYVTQFREGMEFITHPADRSTFVIGRDACGPFVGLVVDQGILVDPTLLDIYTGPAAQRAATRLGEEREKDKREGVQVPDRCGPPLS